MSSLFEPLRVGPWWLPTRIVMAPLTRNRSPGAVPPPMVAEYYAQRADPKTGASLIISEATAISHQGQGYANVPGLYSADQLAGWRRVTDAVHARGGRIVAQMWHVGRVSHNSLQPGGAAPVAPSSIAAKAQTYLVGADGKGGFAPTSMPRPLSDGEIGRIIEQYATAARNAVRVAGFDGVELHAANGYLLDQFMKTGANHRTDSWGGSIENRARFTLEATKAVCDAIGAERTGIRLSPVTPANGINDDDPQPLFEHVVRELARHDMAYIHVIEGATGGPRKLPDRPFDDDAMHQAYRDAGGKAAWMANNGYDASLAQRMLSAGKVDLVAFGKPFIANPDLAVRLRQGGPFNALDRDTLYGGDAHGYTDYPALAG